MCLSAKRSEILAKWDEAARRELAPARHQSKPALRDELPEFLKCIEDGLRQGDAHVHIENRKTQKAESHGIERARVPEYTLEQMLFEYHLLRDVLFDSLEESCRLCPNDRAYIHASLDTAMRAAAQKFSDIRIAAEQMGVARLERERELRERFVATLTHDLKTPLTAVMTSAQLILRTPDLPDTCFRLTSRILSNVDRADRMIQDLLDANLIQAGDKLPIQVEPNELRELVIQAIDEISIIHGQRVILENEGPIYGFWDGSAIRRCVENLIQNAIKYGDPEKKVTLRIATLKNKVIISTHNFGNPIPQKEQDLLFTQFHRSDSAKASGKKGWGLGLTLVRGVMDAHEGSITLESNAESGTTFTMTFPLDARSRHLE